MLVLIEYKYPIYSNNLIIQFEIYLKKTNSLKYYLRFDFLAFLYLSLASVSHFKEKLTNAFSE